MIQLRRIGAVLNRIEDLTPLFDLRSLEFVALSGNPLSNVAVAEQVAALREREIEVELVE
jgi:Leucine-rich repeat (LRR) protein